MKQQFMLIPFAVVLFVFARSPTASACTTGTGPEGHYYAQLQSISTNAADQGAYCTIETDTLASGPIGNDFVTHEMWYTFGNPHGAYWVEAGFFRGNGSREHRLLGRQPKRRRPERAFCQRRLESRQLVRRVRADRGLVFWNVYVGNSHIGTSTSNCAPDGWRDVNGGLEATNASSFEQVHGHIANMEVETNNSWASGWPERTPLFVLPCRRRVGRLRRNRRRTSWTLKDNSHSVQRDLVWSRRARRHRSRQRALLPSHLR